MLGFRMTPNAEDTINVTCLEERDTISERVSCSQWCGFTSHTDYVVLLINTHKIGLTRTILLLFMKWSRVHVTGPGNWVINLTCWKLLVGVVILVSHIGHAVYGLRCSVKSFLVVKIITHFKLSRKKAFSVRQHNVTVHFLTRSKDQKQWRLPEELRQEHWRSCRSFGLFLDRIIFIFIIQRRSECLVFHKQQLIASTSVNNPSARMVHLHV